MGSLFADKTFGWDGVTYTIPARQVLEAIARVEEHITLPELLAFGARSTIPTSKLSRAYGELIRYAGGQVTDEEVYQGMFSAMVGAPEHSNAIVTACAGLIQMMVPKSKGNPVRAPGEEAPNLGNSPASVRPASSRSPGSGSLSAPDGSPRVSSGSSRRKKSK